MATSDILLSAENVASTIGNNMKTHSFSNHFPVQEEKTTTTTAVSLHSPIQNYLPYRCATSQRVNQSFLASYFIKKQTNIFFDKHPARFYIQPRTMNINQEYSRYRDAQTYYSNQSNFYQIPSYLQMTKQHENEYSRYRDSSLSRQKSVSRSKKHSKIHYKCRGLNYDSEAQRFQFSDDKVPWHVDFADYKPTEYTTTKIQKNPKADSSDPSTITKFNQIDGKIDRRSFTGHYYIDPETKRPRNPVGRTGMTGRGRLYHWGPNHAGDPVVTRWKRDNNGSIIYRRMNVYERPKPVLEFVAIQRRDTKQWALPGGMVDPGEEISETVKREFCEEAAQNGDIDSSQIGRLFSNGHKLFESYIDDPRNTDNAWMETVAMHFHDATGELTKSVHLNAGDDADRVVWCPIDRTLDLYANHKDFLKIAVDRLNAFW